MCGCLLCAPYWGPDQQPREGWALTGNQTNDRLLCSPVLSPLSHTSQGPDSTFYSTSAPLDPFWLRWEPLLSRQQQCFQLQSPGEGTPLCFHQNSSTFTQKLIFWFV